MTRSEKLAAILSAAQEEHYTKGLCPIKTIVDKDEDTGEIERLKIRPVEEETFRHTELIALAEALNVFCYVTINSYGNLAVHMF